LFLFWIVSLLEYLSESGTLEIGLLVSK
jgi:hypothetical protein